MSRKKMTDTRQLRSINRAAILDLIRAEEPISRSQISARLGLSLPTVLRIVEELIEDDLVHAAGRQGNGLGRPGELLQFNGGAHWIASVDLGCPEMNGAVADLCGTVHLECQRPLQPGQGEANLENLFLLIQDLLDGLPESAPGRLRGIALGVPGANNTHDGVVIQSTYLGWEQLPICEQLFRKFHIPVYLESDIHIFTLGEHVFGAARDVNNFVCLTLGSKILAGLMIDGQLYPGHTFQAGLLGSTFPTPQALLEPPAPEGWLDRIASGPNLLRAARERTRDMDPASLPPLVDMLSVYQAADRGFPWARELIDPAMDAVAQMIANLTLILDPQVIVITGKAAGAGDFIRREVLTRLEGRLPSLPEIRISTLGTRSFISGAAALVYRGAFAGD